MASWRRKPNGKYQVRWRDPDGTDRAKECSSKEACLELVKVVQRCEDLGHRYEPRAVRAEPDLHEVAKAWLRDLVSEAEPSTIKAHGHRLDLFLRWLRTHHKRGPLRLSLLTVGLLRSYHVEVDGFEGHPRSLSTRNKYARTVHQLWRWAYDHDDFGQYCGRPKTMKWRAPIPPPSRALAWVDIDRVIAQAHGRHRMLLVLLRYTGLRVEQAMGLVMGDIDFEAGTLYVRPELGKTRTEKVGRLEPLSPHLLAELEDRRNDPKDAWVVPHGQKRERLARSRDVWRFFERAGIPVDYWKRRPHHAFRLAFITNLKTAGVDTEAVEYYVGHDLKIRAVYTDAWALPLKALVEAIPAIGKARPPLRLVDQVWTKKAADGSSGA